MGDLLSLVYHNVWEKRESMVWVAEYALIQMHYIRCLSLDLNTWFISVEDKGGDIELPSMTEIQFDLERCTFDRLNIPETFVCPPLALALLKPSIRSYPAPTLATTQWKATRIGRACWQPTSNLLIPNGISLRH